MLKKLFVILFYINLNISNAQVGINTADPKATLDVVGQQSISSEVDGIIPPRITRQNLINKTVYGSNQIGALIYITDLSGVNNSNTISIDEIGYYFFDGSKWQKVLAGTKNIIGDVKQGFQTSDHNGWIKLDGRAKSTLTTNQQAQATALGIGTNLPDATNSVPMQNGNSLGSINGSNSKSIAQNQLPNVNLSGNVNGPGYGGGGIGGPNNVLPWSSDVGFYYYTKVLMTVDLPLNGGVTQQSLNITPQTMSVNMFIYLGN